MHRIALTFDDGPSQWTSAILDLLAEHEATATFFVLGTRLLERPEAVRRIASEGHELGNHTWSHPRLARDCDDATVIDELERTCEAVETIVGTRMRRFRAPYYDVDERVAALAARLGLVHTPGTVIPPDWLPSSTAGVIATLVLQLIRPGSVVGLHDGAPPVDESGGSDRTATVEAVALILSRLRDRGYECVTASTLLDASMGTT